VRWLGLLRAGGRGVGKARRGELSDLTIPWLFVVAKHRLVDHWRARSARERLQDRLTAIPPEGWAILARGHDELGLVELDSHAPGQGLHRAVAQAVRWGRIPRNPVSSATRPEVPRSTVTPPNIDEVRALLALAQKTDPKLSCWLDIATGSGARRGEVCALRWSDIDPNAPPCGSNDPLQRRRKLVCTSRPPRPTAFVSCGSRVEPSAR